jgi:thioredoxin-like negative regulator of GroEL
LAVVLAAGAAISRLVSARTARLLRCASLDSAENPRLLVFSSRWCADCVVQRELIEQSRGAWRDSVEVSYHDAVSERELASSFGILTVPSLVVAAADGRVLQINHGLADEDRLRSLLGSAA